MLVCFLFGAGYCLFYDVLRAFRSRKNYSDSAVFFQDIFYFSVISLITFLLLLRYTYGEMRAYIFVSIFAGFAFCRITLSKLIFPVFKWMIKIITVAFSAVFGFFSGIFNTVSRHLLKFFRNSAKFIKKITENLKKILKRKRKIVYTKRNV